MCFKLRCVSNGSSASHSTCASGTQRSRRMLPSTLEYYTRTPGSIRCHSSMPCATELSRAREHSSTPPRTLSCGRRTLKANALSARAPVLHDATNGTTCYTAHSAHALTTGDLPARCRPEGSTASPAAARQSVQTSAAQKSIKGVPASTGSMDSWVTKNGTTHAEE